MSDLRPGPNEEGGDIECEDYLDPSAGSENAMQDNVAYGARTSGPNEEGGDIEYEDYLDPSAGSENAMQDNVAYGARTSASS